ncbi:hypothetical protein TNCV_3418181 [Trichonephila clavipes]|nr:hypothetical protein TNCV_3418181 [Trichonephila clavipes]
MQCDRALRHSSFVRCLEAFRSICAVTLPLIRSNSRDSQLAVPNHLRYAQLETNLGIGQAKEESQQCEDSLVTPLPCEVEHYVVGKWLLGAVA